MFGYAFTIDQKTYSSIFSILSGHTDIQLALSISEQRNKTYSEMMSMSGNGVAIVPVRGVLVPYAGDMREISAGAMSLGRIRAAFDKAMADTSVSTVVLAIDSPGGEITDLVELSDEIYAARKKKRVYAYVNGMAASAALVLASAAEKVVASETAPLGSLGVMMAIAKGDNDVEYVVSRQSPNKNDSASDEGRQKIQAMVDGLYDVIAGRVAKYRGIGMSDIETNFGGGDMFLSGEAVKRKMADAVMTFKSFMESMKSGDQKQMDSNDEKVKAALADFELIASENEKLKKLIAEHETKDKADGFDAFLAELETERLITPAMKPSLAFAKTMTADQRNEIKAMLKLRGEAYKEIPEIKAGEKTERKWPIVLPANTEVDLNRALAFNEVLVFAEHRLNKPSGTMTKKELQDSIIEFHRSNGTF